MGIRDIESAREQDLESEKLYFAWKLTAVLSLVVYAIVFIPAIALIYIVASLVIWLYFLIMLNRTKNLFYERIRR